MKYAIDKIEENIATLESLDTKEKKEIPVVLLPEGIEEGSILSYENDLYKLDEVTKEQRKTDIRNKFNRLRRKSIE